MVESGSYEVRMAKAGHDYSTGLGDVVHVYQVGGLITTTRVDIMTAQHTG